MVLGVFIHLIVCFFNTRPDASIFTSSVVLSYILYLQWVALSSATDPDECNPYILDSKGNSSFEIIMGLFFNFFALLTIAGSTSKNEDKTLTNDLAVGMMENEDEANGPEEDIEDAPEGTHVFPISSATILF